MRIIFILIICLGFSCQDKKTEKKEVDFANNFYEISEFHLEYSAIDATIDPSGNIFSSFNLNDAILGIEFPKLTGQKENELRFKFKIKNISGKKTAFKYKIIYQNETYKFNEWDSTGNINPLSSENFYGSWPDSNINVKSTGEIPSDNKTHSFSDEIRIVGNPRFEKQFISNGTNNRWQRNPRVGKYQFYLLIWEVGCDDLVPEYIKNIQ